MSEATLVPTLPFAMNDDHTRRGTKIIAVMLATCRNTHTRRAYIEDFEVFRRFLEMGYGQKLSPAQVVDRLLWGGKDGQTHAGHAHELVDYFRAWCETDGKAPSTVNRRVATLKAIARTGRRLGLLTWALDVRSIRTGPSRTTAGPGAAAVTAIFATLTRDGSIMAVRDLAILRLLYDVALRRGEVAGLDLGDLDLAQDRIRILGKCRTAKEWITVPTQTLFALRSWLAIRGTESGPVFTKLTPAATLRPKAERLTGHGIYRLVKEYGLDHGLKMWPHGLRHSAITEAVKAAGPAGIDLTEVLQFSRHANLNTLMIYRDRLRNVQGTLAAAVAGTADGCSVPAHEPASEPEPPVAPRTAARRTQGPSIEQMTAAEKRAAFEEQLAAVKASYHQPNTEQKRKP